MSPTYLPPRRPACPSSCSSSRMRMMSYYRGLAVQGRGGRHSADIRGVILGSLLHPLDVRSCSRVLSSVLRPRLCGIIESDGHVVDPHQVAGGYQQVEQNRRQKCELEEGLSTGEIWFSRHNLTSNLVSPFWSLSLCHSASTGALTGLPCDKEE